MSASYINRGDLTGDPTNGAALTWDERNQLRTINSTAYSFLYDAFGRREAFDDLGVTETYLYDALQAVQTTNPSQTFFTSPGGEVLAYSSSSGTVVPLTDLLGSTVALTDSGKLPTQYKYEPFGVPTMYGAQSSNYPYLFAGMEYDATGLYHTYARYYHPRLQRFVSEDPLQFAGGDVNLFRYVVDDPVNGVDPLGLQFCFYGFAGELAQLDASFAGNFQGALAHAAGQDMGPAAAEAAASAAGFASVGTSCL